EADQITAWMEERYYWGDVLTQMRAALIRSETDVEQKLSAQRPGGVAAGIWIETLTSAPGLGGSLAQPVTDPTQPYPRRGGPPGYPPPPDQQTVGGAGTANNGVIAIVCRAVSLADVDPA